MPPSPSVESCSLISLPRVLDPRGSLTFIEGGEHIPFRVRRSYWIYDVPGGERRGGHAYRTLSEFVIAVSGSFDVVVEDGTTQRVVTLNRSYSGLFVPPGLWRALENFSTNAVALILASERYDESDYIRDRDEFLRGSAGEEA